MSIIPHVPPLAQPRQRNRDVTADRLALWVAVEEAPVCWGTSADVGLVAHELATRFASRVPAVDPEQLVRQLTAAARLRFSSANTNRRLSAVSQAVGYAATYLRSLRPDGWTLLGSGYPAGTGRVDLAWRHEASGNVMYDELKTSRSPGSAGRDAWLAQADRYAAAGHLQWGPRFVGVRVLPLSDRLAGTLVLPRRGRVRLAPTPAEPLRRVEQTTAGISLGRTW